MIITDVSRGHVLSLDGYPGFVMSQVTFARAGARRLAEKHFVNLSCAPPALGSFLCRAKYIVDMGTFGQDIRIDVPYVANNQ